MMGAAGTWEDSAAGGTGDISSAGGAETAGTGGSAAFFIFLAAFFMDFALALTLAVLGGRGGASWLSLAFHSVSGGGSLTLWCFPREGAARRGWSVGVTGTGAKAGAGAEAGAELSIFL